ncbi:hypothetical protein FACS1894102_5770 [Spirochaetia bacterium]|nr:hypothetical protein FACS1894102_5770 [Spirochaetia bacterium]
MLDDLQQDLGQMRFADFINNKTDLSKQLIQQFVDFAFSADGQKLLQDILTDFLKETRSIDLVIYDIIGQSVKDGLVAFCKNKLPGIIKQVEDFIRESKKEIEVIVNKAIDDEIDTMLFSGIVKIFKDLFTNGNAAGRYKVVAKIISALNEYGDKAQEAVPAMIIDLMKTKTIGAIVKSMEDSGIISVTLIMDFINSKLRELPRGNTKWLEDLLEQRIGDVVETKTLSSFIKTKALPTLFEKIKKTYLYNNKFKSDIRSAVNTGISKISDTLITDLVNVNEINIDLGAKSVKNKILNLWNNFSNTKISSIIGENIPVQVRIKKETLKELWNKKLKTKKIGELYNAAQKHSVYEKVSEWLIDTIKENMANWLKPNDEGEGKITKLVKDALEPLTDIQVNSLVRDFMGKQMKVINILGLVLGAIIGFASALGVSYTNIQNNFSVWMFAGYGIIFALVGIMTNLIAIKMLFRPYKPMFAFLPKKSPFVGVAAANQSKFAVDISKTVNTELLKETELEKKFAAGRNTVKEFIFLKIAKSDYVIIDDFFGKDEVMDKITGDIYSSLQKYLLLHNNELTDFICDFIKRIVGEGKLCDIIPCLQTAIVNKLKDSDLASSVCDMIKKELQGKNLNHYHLQLEKFALGGLNKLIELMVQNLAQNITLENINNFASNHNENFDVWAQKNTIKDIAGSKNFDNINANINTKILNKVMPFLHKAGIPIIERLEKEELSPCVKLSNLFDGAIPKFIEKKITDIIDWMCEELSKNRGDIIKTVKDSFIAPSIIKKHVDPIVCDLVDTKLPRFLRSKQDHVIGIIDTLLENELSNLGFSSSSLEIKKIEKTINCVFDSPHIQHGISSGLSIITKRFFEVPIHDLIRMININSINDLVHIAEPLLLPAVCNVKKNLSNDKVIDTVAKLVAKILFDSSINIEAGDLIKDIEMEKELRKLQKMFFENEKAVAKVSQIIFDALNIIQSNEDFYDDKILRKDLAYFIANLKGDDWHHLQITVIDACKKILLNLNKSLATPTKDAICNDYLIQAAIDACIDKFTDILSAINIQKLVEDEVNNMEAANIEELFYSFAGNYFKEIVFWGWIGIFGGLLTYLISSILAP